MTEDDRVLLGSTDPSWTFGLNLNAGWKGFDLALMFTGAADVYRLFESPGDFDGDANHPIAEWLDAWTPENKDAKMPRVALKEDSPNRPWTTMSSFWIQNASYVRLKNLQFGYNFPAKWLKPLGVEKLRLYYSAENLFTIDNMLVNLDPEGTDTTGRGYPLLQTHSFGVSITF